jgi:hypothetical protein
MGLETPFQAIDEGLEGHAESLADFSEFQHVQSANSPLIEGNEVLLTTQLLGQITLGEVPLGADCLEECQEGGLVPMGDAL